MQTFSDCNHSKATEVNHLFRQAIKLTNQGVKPKRIRCELKSESSSVAIPKSHQWFEDNEAKLLISLIILLKGYI